MKPSQVGHLLSVAAELLSEDDDNVEYDRAVVEMTTELLGLPISDNRDTVHELIRKVRDDARADH